MGNIYGYMRISTKEQSDKQSYARQVKGLERYAKENDFEYLLTFKDDISGATFDRPNWVKLKKLLKPGDTIVFKEISRFTRQAEEGYQVYMELMSRGINLVFIDNPTVSTKYIQQLTDVANSQNLVTKTALKSTIKLLLIVELDRVEQERAIFIKRVNQGIAASDKKSGRPIGSLDKMSEILKADIIEFISDRSIKQIDVMRKHNISRNTLKKYVQIIEAEQ